jgi:hypothetical protein
MAAPRCYCTLFDQNYLARGMALQRSLATHDPQASLVVLCLDPATFDVLASLRLPGLQPIPLALLEKADPELAATRAARSAAEYYFTCKSALMRHVLAENRAAARVTYLDSDLCYFDTPASLEREIEGSSVALTPHRFPPHLADRARYGEYNAGWISVAADAEGRAFLDWWRRSCIASCSMTLEGERFADQGYLNQVPRRFPRTRVVTHPGANVGPWRIAHHRLDAREGRVTLDDVPLVFYHFHHLRRMFWRLYDTGLSAYGAGLTPAMRDLLYRPYLREVAGAADRVRRLGSADCERPLSRASLPATLRIVYELARTGNGIVAP